MANVRDFLLRGASPYYDTHASSTDPTSGRRLQGGIYIISEADRKTTNDGLVSDVYGYGKLDILASVQLVYDTTVSKTTSSVKDTAIYASPMVFSAMQKEENIKALNAVKSYDEYGEYTIGLANNINSLSAFGLSDRISSMVQMNAMQNNHSVNTPFGSVFVSNFIKPQELSYTNRDFLQMQARHGVNQNFNTARFNFQHSIAGVNFNFTEGYVSQLHTIVPSASFNSFHAVAFSSDARQLLMSKNFGAFQFGIESVFGKPQMAEGREDLFASEGNNLSQTLSISHHKNGNLVGVDFGFLRETLTLLGTYSSGAFALGENNTTAFMKANVSQKLFGKTSLIGSVSVGRTSANELQNSLFSNITPLVSRSFVVGLKTEFLKGNFEFTYSHPLAIISGRAFFDGANGKQTIFLTPSAQEQDFAISYAVNSKNSRLSLNGAYILNQNNLNVKPTLGFFVSVGKNL